MGRDGVSVHLRLTSEGGIGQREERWRERVSKYSRKTYKTPSRRVSSAAGAHSKCTHVKDDCSEGRNVFKLRVR